MEQPSLLVEEKKPKPFEQGVQAFRDAVIFKNAVTHFIANDSGNPAFVAGRLAEFCEGYQKMAELAYCEEHPETAKSFTNMTIPEGRHILLLVKVIDNYSTADLNHAIMDSLKDDGDLFHGLRVLDMFNFREKEVTDIKAAFERLEAKEGFGLPLKLSVNRDAFSQVLDCLNGPDHYIRELQYTRDLDKLNSEGEKKNPINILMDDWNNYAQRTQEP